MLTTKDKALEFLLSLDEDKIIEAAEKAGMPDLSYLERCIIARTELQKQFALLQKDFYEKLEALTKQIESECIHEWGETENLGDDHDGWSRVKITYYHRRTCKVCGKVDDFTSTSDY